MGTPRKESLIDHLAQRIIGSDDFNFTYYLKECLMRLPETDLKAVAYDKDIYVLKTTANTVLGLDPLLYTKAGKGDKVLVIFVTNFSKCPAHEIMYIIAHEFAHVFLGHYTKSLFTGTASEIKADEQLKKWGFEEELQREQFQFPHVT
jgi:hypothetical protein